MYSNRGLKYQATVKWLSLIVGPIGVVSALFLDYQKKHSKSLEVTKVSPSKSASKGADVESKDLSSATTQDLSEKQRY